jgi:hypothetical protein
MGALILKVLVLAGLAALPQRGDLVFADWACGAMCDAIEDVTLAQFEVDGPRLSHVGVLDVVDGRLEVLEAVGSVKATPWAEWLHRQGLVGVWVARPSVPPAVRAQAATVARGWAGAPYDDRFAWGGKAFYCAELVARAYVEAGAPEALFAPLPMAYTGRNGAVSPVWLLHFEKLGVPIPSGEPGLSPLALYLRLRLLADRAAHDDPGP